MNVKKLLSMEDNTPLTITMKNGKEVYGELDKKSIEGSFFVVYDTGSDVESCIVNMKDVSLIEEEGGHRTLVTEEKPKEKEIGDFGKYWQDAVHDLRAWHMNNGLNNEEAGYKAIQQITEYLNKGE